MSSIMAVKDFMKTFGQEVPDSPRIPSKEVVELRIELIEEELREFKEAVSNQNIVEMLDALTDLQYVLDGTYIACGLDGVKDSAFIEVHRSNMSKLEICGCCSEEGEVHGKIIYGTADKECPVCNGTGKFVHYSESGKVLKGSEYFKPDIKNILFQHLVSIGFSKGEPTHG